MDHVPFYRTRMGQQYYGKTMPELVKQLERLNEILERLLQQNGQGHE